MIDAAFLSTIGTVLVAGFIAYVLAMWGAMVIWTHRDVSARSADPALRMAADAAVIVFNLPGLMLYLALRPPETRADALARELEAEALVRDIEVSPACPACGHAVAADFVACPHCAAALQEACRCGRQLRSAWVMCPYCTAERPRVSGQRVGSVPVAPAQVAAAGRPAQAPARPGHVRLSI